MEKKLNAMCLHERILPRLTSCKLYRVFDKDIHPNEATPTQISCVTSPGVRSTAYTVTFVRKCMAFLNASSEYKSAGFIIISFKGGSDDFLKLFKRATKTFAHYKNGSKVWHKPRQFPHLQLLSVDIFSYEN